MNTKYMLLKNLGLDEASDIVETVCTSRQLVNCRLEKGVAPMTVDCIIEIKEGKSNFTIRYSNENILLEFSDDEEIFNIEIPANSFTDLTIR